MMEGVLAPRADKNAIVREKTRAFSLSWVTVNTNGDLAACFRSWCRSALGCHDKVSHTISWMVLGLRLRFWWVRLAMGLRRFLLGLGSELLK
jgi:hypothetical protein